MTPSKAIIYFLVSILFISCEILILDELSLEDSLEEMIVGKWSLSEFSTDDALLTSTDLKEKSEINIKSTKNNSSFEVNFLDNPKQILIDGTFSITLTGIVQNKMYSNTYNCNYFFEDILLGKWGIINSNLYLSEEQLHATILIKDLTDDSLKLNIKVEKKLDQEGLQGNLKATFCMTFKRKTN